MARRSKRERSRAARYAALTRIAAEGPENVSAPARAGFMRRFELEVDLQHPDASPAERETLIRTAKRLYFARLARRKSARKTETESPAV